MAADPPRTDRRVIAAYLDDVELELDAVKRLIMDPPSRFAAFHLQQAAEKLVKAVRLCRGLRLSVEHNLELLIAELPDDDVWRERLVVLEPLSTYATSFRYPSPAGKRKDGLSNDEALVWIKTIADRCSEARTLIADAGNTATKP